MEKVSKVVKDWFKNADEDFRAASVLHQLDSMKYLRVVPYLCQQAAEKSIKGYLAHRKIKFDKTHDISLLASLVLPLHPDLADLLKQASRLSIFAIQFRYPDAGNNEPTLDDSRLAIQVAKGVYEKMLAMMPRDNPMGL